MNGTHTTLLTLLTWGLVFAALAPVSAEPPRLPVPAFDQSAVGARGYFYVGGTYVGEPGKEIMQGQIYVEVVAPKDVRRPYPLVLIHGAAQTATNWMGTPDGRKGWTDYFVEQGYIVYMIDQPMRGRSAWHPSNGATRMFTAHQEEFQFTANAVAGTWPQAKTHTQSGAFGWLIADARPALVKGIIAIEPSGPPFEATIIGTGKARRWGPTDAAITYDPPLKDASEIAVEREAAADGPDLFVCWMQKAPARRLVNLKNVPVMVMAAEASYHQIYDHCTVKYLNQAGVNAEYIRLQDRGIRGNGHMVMIEKNNLEIARLVDEWVRKKVK